MFWYHFDNSKGFDRGHLKGASESLMVVYSTVSTFKEIILTVRDSISLHLLNELSKIFVGKLLNIRPMAQTLPCEYHLFGIPKEVLKEE